MLLAAHAVRSDAGGNTDRISPKGAGLRDLALHLPDELFPCRVEVLHTEYFVKKQKKFNILKIENAGQIGHTNTSTSRRP